MTGTALVIYALIGPGAWVLFFAMILMGRARMSRLKRPPLPLPASPPELCDARIRQWRIIAVA